MLGFSSGPRWRHGGAEPLAAVAEAVPTVRLVNWRAARRAERACCCPARPVAVAVMPPAADRAHRTEVLLCGHHYRISRPALAAAGAVVVDMTGVPLADLDWPEGWPGLDQLGDRPAALAGRLTVG